MAVFEMLATVRGPPGSRHVARFLLLGVVSLGLAACIGKGEDEAGTGAQVVAIVNDREISVARVNEMSHPRDPDGIAPEASKEDIDSLIDEELLVQGALKQGLDRDDDVLQALEGARRQVLAHYFAERNLYPKNAATAREIEDFYRSNPILFENRKRLRLKNFSIEGIELTDELRAEIDQIHSIYALQDLLDKHDIRYRSEVAVLSTDQLPVEKLQEFAHAEVGDLMIGRQSSGKALLMFVTAIEDDTAMSFDRAKPYIERYLTSTRNRQAINDYLSAAKAVATISYPRTAGRSERRAKVAPSARGSSASPDEAILNGIAEVRAAANDAAP